MLLGPSSAVRLARAGIKPDARHELRLASSTMTRLQRLFKLAYAFSCATFILALLCVAGFILRWCGATFLTSLSQNAGYVGYAAMAAVAACFLTVLKASQLSQELQAEREAAARTPAAAVEPADSDAD